MSAVAEAITKLCNGYDLFLAADGQETGPWKLLSISPDGGAPAVTLERDGEQRTIPWSKVIRRASTQSPVAAE